VVTCAATDRDALAAAVGGRSLSSVVLADVEIAGTPEPAELVAGVLAAAESVSAATAGHDLDAFVLFGTLAGTCGLRGQTMAAAAGATLDAYAGVRHADGRPALAVSWGAWADVTPAAAGNHEQHLRLSGLPPMDPALSLAALPAAAGPSVAIVDIAWDRFAPASTADRPSRQFDAVPEAVAALRAAERAGDNAGDNAGDTAGARLRADLLGMAAADRTARVLTLVREKAATVLGHAGPDAVEPIWPFKELGFDSLTAVDLRGQLAAATGLRLPATLVFDHPTPAALAEHLLAELTGAPAVEETARAVVADHDDPIVIVGMACRYPGGVESPEDLWRLVAEGTDAIGDLPTFTFDAVGEHHDHPPGVPRARGYRILPGGGVP